MSQLKSVSRTTDAPDNSKYRQQARQLQELFPSWSNDDLQSLLIDVQGDVERAATLISDGGVEPWGSVSRKKDKKIPVPANFPRKDSFPSRGDSRGARGGRGGRGASTRGGPTHRGRGGPPRGGAVNGRSPRAASPNISSKSDAMPGDRKDIGEPVDGVNNAPESTSKIGAGPSVDPSSSHIATPSSNASWGAVNSNPSWSGDGEPNGSAVTPLLTKSSSKPANSKLSWAQVASSQEKQPLVTPSPATSHTISAQPPASEIEPAPHPLNWEEPKTAQATTRDEDTHVKSITPSIGTPEAEDPATKQPEQQIFLQQHDLELETSTTEPASPQIEQQPQLVASMSEPISLPPLATPESSQTPTVAASPKLSGRSAAGTHRNSARYKNIDQPVVMPSSFGTGLEKVGMQFGSLSLGGESILDANPTEPEAPATSDTPSPDTPKTQAPIQHDSQPPLLAAPSSLTTSIFSQQPTQPTQPQSTQSPPVQPSATTHALPSITQAQQGLTHPASTSPIQQFAQQHQAQQPAQQQAQHHQAPSHTQQHALTSAQQQHQQQSQHPLHATQTHNQYTQHGLPTHIDPTQQAQSQQQQQQQQQQQNATHASYFGRGETAGTAPYFHTPTPPAGQGQDNPYGSFGQLNAQGPHQQASHLANFGTQDYGYGDGQRGFYDSYQPASFSNRSILGHEDAKNLQAAQQPPTTGGIPPSSAQGAQPHTTLQGGGQPQPTGAQAPQQGYHVPYPYYTYPQSQQFYGYNSYPALPQPFKYPAMYQPPPGPGSAPSPVGKQPSGGVQPQGNPYSQGLYPQAGYDDYAQHAHHSQHSQQHSHGLGLGQNSVGATDYGKQLYGAAGQGSMQAFMGLGAQGAGGAAPTSNANGPRGAASPETPYKPYASKDVGNVAGRVGGQQQSQVQGQPQGQGQGGQGPQGQGFYGGARFGGGAGVGVGGPQQGTHHPQGGPQGHLGYPQGGNDGSFYQYRGQQQGYWQ